jgi:hypothetical protein
VSACKLFARQSHTTLPSEAGGIIDCTHSTSGDQSTFTRIVSRPSLEIPARCVSWQPPPLASHPRSALARLSVTGRRDARALAAWPAAWWGVGRGSGSHSSNSAQGSSAEGGSGREEGPGEKRAMPERLWQGCGASPTGVVFRPGSRYHRWWQAWVAVLPRYRVLASPRAPPLLLVVVRRLGKACFNSRPNTG